ncbi:IS66 family insertion sequence element accessory protein TnpA [Thiolapillus sp.]|uniref:IS66 family insertion sequence element accessory protein TnpA n=1 Tax=Thiolapillus sp. TaxID=2017437 RepID=UPI0025E68202|nr:hypothetical protein [Thiolapillus sp.]
MAPTDTTDRTTFWQDHVTTWQASDLTQKAYCEAHGLRYATFGYWVRKLRTPSGDHQESASGFIPVTLSPVDGGLVLALPNGLEIRGIEANNLGLVRDLLGMLA